METKSAIYTLIYQLTFIFSWIMTTFSLALITFAFNDLKTMDNSILTKVLIAVNTPVTCVTGLFLTSYISSLY